MEEPDLKGDDKITNVLTVLKDGTGSGKLTYDHKWPQ